MESIFGHLVKNVIPQTSYIPLKPESIKQAGMQGLKFHTLRWKGT